MKLVVPAQLTERLSARSEQLDRLARAMAQSVAILRARIQEHRVAISVVGGGIAGMAFATHWRSMARFAVVLAGAATRATALSLVARARVERAVRKEWARASRTK